MNYRLSCITCVPLGKNGFVFEADGKELCCSVFGTVGLNVKENILETVYRGIRYAKDKVSHEDILYIEVQNQYLCNWLSGLIEYKEYQEQLDRVFDALEGIDCKYRFSFTKNKYALQCVKNRELSKPVMSDMMTILSTMK